MADAKIELLKVTTIRAANIVLIGPSAVAKFCGCGWQGTWRRSLQPSRDRSCAAPLIVSRDMYCAKSCKVCSGYRRGHCHMHDTTHAVLGRLHFGDAQHESLTSACLGVQSSGWFELTSRMPQTPF